jgi:selenide,water dikinase
MTRNRRHAEATLGARLTIEPAVVPALASLVYEAETSGGLLFSISRDRADGVLPAFAAAGEPCWEVGEVVSEPLIRVRA